MKHLLSLPSCGFGRDRAAYAKRAMQGQGHGHEHVPPELRLWQVNCPHGLAKTHMAACPRPI